MGSEMCIRDRFKRNQRGPQRNNGINSSNYQNPSQNFRRGLNPTNSGNYQNQRNNNQRPRSQNPNARRIGRNNPLNQIPQQGNPYQLKSNNYQPPGVNRIYYLLI